MHFCPMGEALLSEAKGGTFIVNKSATLDNFTVRVCSHLSSLSVFPRPFDDIRERLVENAKTFAWHLLAYFRR